MPVKHFVSRIERGMYNASSENFIPITCHYDKYTLLTKNGELIQTFQIDGINADNVSKALHNLRDKVRQSVRDNIECHNMAFWIHTIRRKDNLDDETEYDTLFAKELHKVWQDKNQWHDKFINTLYVSIVYDAPITKIQDYSSFLRTLSTKTMVNYKEQYHRDSIVKLTETVDSILGNLVEFHAKRIGIRIEGDKCYSDQMFLFRRIMQLYEKECELPVNDLSTDLASHQYAVGCDMIEVIGNDTKKFAAILSLKEYQEISADSIDIFLQIPMEFIATEVFYFVEREDVVGHYEEQDYVLGVSHDKELRELKSLDKIIDQKDNPPNKFCKQQISIMVIGETTSALDEKLTLASNSLANLGIVHVREDINLEKAFWGQLPGNFNFLSRMSPAIIDCAAALATLHNAPIGHKYNVWGKALTLFSSTQGTPYFCNLHDHNNNGFNAIIGPSDSGRTTLINFLLTMTDKYNPSTLHFVDNISSAIYVKVRKGTWIQQNNNLFNPFLLDDNTENREIIVNFFKILLKFTIIELTPAEADLLRYLVDEVMESAKESRSINMLFSKLNASDKGGKGLTGKLAIFMEGGLFHGIFDSDIAVKFEPEKYYAYNLQAFDDSVFEENHYPKEKRLIEEYETNLDSLRAIKAAIIYYLSKVFDNDCKGRRKIIAINEIKNLTNLKQYSYLISEINQIMQKDHNVFIINMSIEEIEALRKEKIEAHALSEINTRFIIPPDIKIPHINELLKLNETNYRKFMNIEAQDRAFLIEQDNNSVSTNLEFGNNVHLLYILSASSIDINKYLELEKKYGTDTEQWLDKLFHHMGKG